MLRYFILLFPFFILNTSCKETQKADLIFISGEIYTAEDSLSQVEAIAIEKGKIVALGKNEEVLRFKSSKTEIIDLQGKFMMPGLIEGHGHFLELGKSLINLNLINTKSWKEIIDSVKSRLTNTPANLWIEGRGWHQEKWTPSAELSFKGYPYHDQLSLISANNPVILYHASGHALLANQKAMDLAGITKETADIQGGKIVKDSEGKLTGVFEENAMSLVEKGLTQAKKKLPDSTRFLNIKRNALLAQAQAFRYGISSFQDAGLTMEEIRAVHQLCIQEDLEIKLFVMLLSDKNPLEDLALLPFKSLNPRQFKCNAVKAYLDGALGSHGAWLLKPYDDLPESSGQLTTPIEILHLIAEQCSKRKLQFCVHAIGDRANREVLNIFESNIKRFHLQDHRWRIEHAQHIDSLDIPRFWELGVIASMQAIHCTSDAPFVLKRLGFERARKTSYAWRRIIDSKAHLANGTDTPVEEINPFACIYAACTRKRLDNGLTFFEEEKMTREEALKSYTIWNAYASRDELTKGSFKVGKDADLVILDKNLLTCKDAEIPKVLVKSLYINGKLINN